MVKVREYVFEQASGIDFKEYEEVFLSDPAPNENDTERFVDEYMRMKKDGHIKFYTKDEWNELGSLVKLRYVDDFET